MIKTYGDLAYRNKKCPHETPEQIAFVNWLKDNHEQYYELLIHPKNEGKRNHYQAAKDKAMGSLNKGASDIIIMSEQPFVCELKRKDCTLRKPTKKQIEFLDNCDNAGCFACIAYGSEAAIEAFNEWLEREEA